MSTAFHPQTDGETECVNQELEIYLQTICGNEPTLWNKYLPLAEFVHNQQTHEVHKSTPFQLMYGYNPVAIPSVIPRTDTPAVEQRLNDIDCFRQEALATHELA